MSPAKHAPIAAGMPERATQCARCQRPIESGAPGRLLCSSCESLQATQAPAAAAWFHRAWLPVVVGCACFLNSLPNGFVYDDVPQVAENPAIRSITNFHAIWLSGWTNTYSGAEARMHPNPDLLYRPFTVFTLALGHSLHGLWAPGFRLVNIALHGLTCFLIWEFLRRLFEDRSLATWGALLFAVHPVHVEAVAYIVGRAEVLATIFSLLGLLVLVPKNRPSDTGRAWRAMPLFFLALLSKETAVSYIPMALIVLHACRGRTPIRGVRWWGVHTLCLLLPLLVYLRLRVWALEGAFMRAPAALLNPIVDAEMPARLLMPFEVLGHYVRLLLFPLHLSADYGYEVFNPRAGVNAMTLLGLAAAAGLVAALLGYLRAGGHWRRLAVCAALFIAAYALFSNSLLLIGVSVAERLMYWPSVAACGLLAALALSLGRRPAGAARANLAAPRFATVAGTLVLAAFATRTVIRNTDWYSALRLATHDAACYPQSAALNAGAALQYIDVALQTDDPAARRQNLERADEYSARALQHYPVHWGNHRMRSDILSLLGQADMALHHIRQAVQLNPGETLLRRRLGRRLFQAGQFAEALPYLEEEAALAPDDYVVLTMLGEAHLKLGRSREALPHLKNALRIAPDDRAPLLLMSEALLKLNELEQAVPVLEKLAAVAPHEVRPPAVLAKLLVQRDPPAALRYAQQAHALLPQDPETALLLADALIATGRSDEGLSLYVQTLDRLSPEHPLRRPVESRLETLRAATTQPSADRP
ncbi:MAG TPA: tetratricopeptide repeat protein [Phycisphaerae bacterium]|jgi:tetratricopeptide (TPR) repeat protein|nr:tetratricopeptide repeat protein [Phycisphaerae bacterium]